MRAIIYVRSVSKTKNNFTFEKLMKVNLVFDCTQKILPPLLLENILARLSTRLHQLWSINICTNLYWLKQVRLAIFRMKNKSFFQNQSWKIWTKKRYKKYLDNDQGLSVRNRVFTERDCLYYHRCNVKWRMSLQHVEVVHKVNKFITI